MENYFIYDDFQFQAVAQVLVFGFGAMVAGLVYFLTTASNTAPRYRLSSWLSAVVMVSAALILYNQYASWTDAFDYTPISAQSEAGAVATPAGAAVAVSPDGGWVNPVVPYLADSDANLPAAVNAAADEDRVGRTFSNGFRYVNWTIDVPCLQIQILAVLGLTGALFWKLAMKFAVGGLAMVYTSYVAQFYEYGFHPDPAVSGDGSAATMFWVFYIISWVAFAYILYVMHTQVFTDEMLAPFPERGRSVMKGVYYLLVGSWLIYPVAIGMPFISFTDHGVVWRQYLFTAADVISKVIYGVMLGQAATYRSAHEGFGPALSSCSIPPGAHAKRHDEHGRIAGDPTDTPPGLDADKRGAHDPAAPSGHAATSPAAAR